MEGGSGGKRAPQRETPMVTAMRVCNQDPAAAERLIMMMHAVRYQAPGEFKFGRTVEPLQGSHDWHSWYQTMVGCFGGHAGGRLLYLLEEDPSTSEEAYQYIFADAVTNEPIDPTTAAIYRKSDIVQAGSILTQVITPALKMTIAEDSVPGNINGIGIWRTLKNTYGGVDFGAAQEANTAIAKFKLGKRTPQEASRDVKALYARIINAGGEPHTEKQKIETVLRVFNTGSYKALRCTIQENWLSGRAYTFDSIISRFIGEDAVARAAEDSDDDVVESSAKVLSSKTGTGIQIKGRHQQQQQHGNNAGTRSAGSSATGKVCFWCLKKGHIEAHAEARPAVAHHIQTADTL